MLEVLFLHEIGAKESSESRKTKEVMHSLITNKIPLVPINQPEDLQFVPRRSTWRRSGSCGHQIISAAFLGIEATVKVTD
jgi:hypothetical protein